MTEKYMKTSGKKIEFAKGVVVIWLSITMVLLGFAVSWGVNITTVTSLNKKVQLHDEILRGTKDHPGIQSDVSEMKKDLKNLIKSVNKVYEKIE